MSRRSVFRSELLRGAEAHVDGYGSRLNVHAAARRWLTVNLVETAKLDFSAKAVSPLIEPPRMTGPKTRSLKLHS